MNRSWKKRIAMLSGGAALGMATLAFAAPASADVNCNHQQYPDFSYGSYYGYPNRPMSRHEQQHDTNRNGRLEPWEHEALHQHEAQAAAYTQYTQYRRPYVRHYRTRPAWSWSWTFGW
ncbi:MAG TPA: hypothetical protein VFB62_24345 [Polyangiaceae bacterium]|jgi:hypothetical protein|nr:hypothetical protein [Polyangiaceae bacterium]